MYLNMSSCQKKYLNLHYKTNYCNRLTMDLKTSLSGRLRNTSLPKTSALFPLFEAIVNSIHAIDERVEQDSSISLDDCTITIKVIRSSQLSTDNSRKPEIIGFKIIDNGIGFNEKNFNSFLTLDSEYKAAKGCKGIGRLLWLKAFSSVRIISSFLENSTYYKRCFSFSKNGLSNDSIDEYSQSEYKTEVELNHILSEYSASIPKTAEKLADKIIDHCFWYFLREGGAPHIIVEDGDDNANLNNIFEYSKSAELSTDSFSIRGNKFEVTHIKLKEGSPYRNCALYGAANRLVINENLETKIQGLYGDLVDEESIFSYVCFVASPYLTEHVSPERLRFDISEKLDDSILSEVEISFEEIRKGVVESVSKFLAKYVNENLQRTEDRIIEFVNTKEPRYRSIIKYLNASEKAFNPNITDKDLDLKLHKKLQEVEANLIEQGHDLLYNTSLSKEEFKARLNAYLQTSNDAKASDLASYIAKRRVIIEIFEKALCQQENGKYVTEDVIHQLIMPMRETSDSIYSEECSNLWLIDERLSFHSFLASDKTIKSMPITSNDSTKEPDICSLNVYENPILINDGKTLPLASITIVELKRPMRDDAKVREREDPIQQALTYLEKIRLGQAKTPQGRLIPKSEDIPGYCYIICDLTESVIRCCKGSSLQVTADQLGYFGYNHNYKAYIEVISFDRLLQAAKERNRMFFQKLGIPTGL